MVLDAGMHLVAGAHTHASPATTVPPEKMMHLAASLPTARPIKDHLAASPRPRPHDGVLPTLVRENGGARIDHSAAG